MWASLAAPCTSIAFPLFVAGTVPPVLAAGGEKPSGRFAMVALQEDSGVSSR